MTYFAGAMLLDGRWVDRADSMVIRDPDTGLQIGTVPVADASDVDQAVAAATNALAEVPPTHERARILGEAAGRINESTDFRSDAMPFGGRGNSGVGREGARSAMLSMTDAKVVVWNDVTVPGLG